MTNDRELLELAAKIYGLTLWKNRADAFLLFDGPHLDGAGKFIKFWNPLERDTDLCELIIEIGKRGITIDVDGCNTRVGEIWEMNLDSPISGFRRAIVRAAAEIGRAMA